MFSRDIKSLRTLLLKSDGNTHISSFDATRDGIFQPSKGSRNGQRASIIIHHKKKDEQHIYTTNLMRWISEERPLLITNLHYANATSFITSEIFPKIGDEQLVEFWAKIGLYKRNIGSTIYKQKKKSKEKAESPPPILHYAYIPRTARYFITSMPTPMRSTGVNAFAWNDQWTRDVAIVALNSNVFYWLWCALGDGFDVTGEVISSMALPNVPKDDIETRQLYDALLNAAEECVTYHTKWNMRIPNYNFNKRMDILLDIDAWIVHHVAPDLNLPRDIFAQYKSNSFLRPLDLSNILNTEGYAVVDE
jgi:hypothetical protein